MAEKLVCDKCGATYTDDKSIQWAKSGFKDWEERCKEDGTTPRGLGPCPKIHCPGELILTTE